MTLLTYCKRSIWRYVGYKLGACFIRGRGGVCHICHQPGTAAVQEWFKRAGPVKSIQMNKCEETVGHLCSALCGKKPSGTATSSGFDTWTAWLLKTTSLSNIVLWLVAKDDFSASVSYQRATCLSAYGRFCAFKRTHMDLLDSLTSRSERSER